MDLISWLLIGLFLGLLYLFIWWFSGEDIQTADIFGVIICIVMGPIAAIIPFLFIFISVIIYLYDSFNTVIIVGRKKKESQVEYKE